MRNDWINQRYHPVPAKTFLLILVPAQPLPKTSFSLIKKKKERDKKRNFDEQEFEFIPWRILQILNYLTVLIENK